MSINIQLPNNKEQTFIISFDTFGNLYLEDFINLTTYQVNINNTDNLCAEKDNSKIISVYSNIGKIKQKAYKKFNKYKQEDNCLEYTSTEFNADDELIEKYGDSNVQFIFNETESSICIYEKEEQDISALYDTYVYDDKNMLKFKASHPNNENIYIVKLYPNTVVFRIIGDMEKHYKLELIDSNLEFKKI